MSRAIIVGRGKTSVELSGDFLTRVDNAIRESMPITIAAMEEATSEVMAAALPLWPVKSGTSKRAFREITRIPNPSEVETSIVNDARTRKGFPYAVLIKTRIDYTPWQELVRRPLLDRADEVATKAAGEIAALIGGSGG